MLPHLYAPPPLHHPALRDPSQGVNPMFRSREMSFWERHKKERLWAAGQSRRNPVKIVKIKKGEQEPPNPNHPAWVAVSLAQVWQPSLLLCFLVGWLGWVWAGLGWVVWFGLGWVWLVGLGWVGWVGLGWFSWDRLSSCSSGWPWTPKSPLASNPGTGTTAMSHHACSFDWVK